jgi:hypothetical protein
VGLRPGDIDDHGGVRHSDTGLIVNGCPNHDTIPLSEAAGED